MEDAPSADVHRLAGLVIPACRSLGSPGLPFPRPKKGSAHPHERRSFLNRDFEIAAHSHRKLGNGARNSSFSRSRSSRRAAKYLRECSGSGASGGIAMRPSIWSRSSPSSASISSRSFPGEKPNLLAFAGHIHFEQNARMKPGLFRDAIHVAGELQRIDAVHQLKKRQAVADFVFLQVADEMPASAG